MKIVVVTADQKQGIEVMRILEARGATDAVHLLSAAEQMLGPGFAAMSPDVAIIHAPTVGMVDLDRIERLSHTYPRLAFIVACNQDSSEFLLQAMRAGIREVLSTPIVAEALLAAVQRIEGKRSGHATTQGKVLAFISCKGGSGATFLATNLGYALASVSKKRVALIDLNLQFGDASLFVSDQKPQATIADVAQQMHRLDATFLAASMLEIAPGFSLLAAPEDPAHANEVKPEHIGALITLARQHYDFVVLDIGRNLDAVSIHALDHADMIFPVLQATLPYVRDGKRLMALFRSLDYQMTKIHVILNRYEKKTGDIQLRDVQDAFGVGQIQAIPNHYQAAASSVNQGVPILKLHSGSPVSKALHAFAMKIGGDPQTAQTPWLLRMFTRS